MKTAAIGAILIGLIIVSGCIDNTNNQTQANNGGETINFSNISAQELKQKLENKDFFLLDVHIPEQEHIAGTDDFIPFNEIEANLSKLPQDKNTPIVVYCRSGNMSLEASQKLIDLGYTNVMNLDGGIKAFNAIQTQNQEEPMIKEPTKADLLKQEVAP
ncbi:MAG: rhodanese-like domain-containing protein, partial [Candidatus Diapherotrites archaeon]